MGLVASSVLLMLGQAGAFEAPCATQQVLKHRGVRPPMRDVPPPPHLPAKGDRDAWGSWPNEQFSANFVLKWGPESISSQTTKALLDVLEDSWDRFVGDMNYEAPPGSDQFRFNVYIAETGQGSMSSYGAAGYFSYDGDGWPMVVIARAALDAPDGGAGTAVHEFFHAIQDAMSTWYYQDLGGWYYEATACWSVPEVIPNDQTYLTFIFGYALLPNYAVNFFDYFDTGVFTEYHQYGAFLFPRYLTEHVADWSLIRDSWRENNAENDPLAALQDLLEKDGHNFDEVFSNFAAHNALWDYEDGETYGYYTDYYANQFSQWDCRVSDKLPRSGDPQWREANSDCLPQRYAYNLLRIDRPKAGHLKMDFEGDSRGSRSTASDWRLQWAMDSGSDNAYQSIEMDGLNSADVVCNVDQFDQVNLVVSNHGAAFKDNEFFDYRFKMEIVSDHEQCGEIKEDTGGTTPVDTASPEDETHGGFSEPTIQGGGCGCSKAPSKRPVAALWLAILGGVLMFRRPRKP